MSKNWQFRENKPFLKEVPDKQSDGIAYQTSIIYDGEPIDVTWFPERTGVQISGGSGVDERVGRDAAIFGIVLIKLMLSGENCFKEL